MLPPALPGELRSFESAAGRLAYYFGGAAQGVPLLLIHSINAAGSAYEMKPLYEAYASRRPVFAVDLPGYGHSDRSDRAYSVELMTKAISEMAAEIHRLCGPGPIDAVALSLSCEFLARAAASFRTLGFISPTGLNRKTIPDAPPGSTRAMPRLYKLIRRQGLYNWLTRPGVIRYFLRRTWGSAKIDEGVAQYAILTSREPGAANAPFYFLGGFLFSRDIARIYERLTQPVWMVHGVRGDFTDYRLESAFPHWTRLVLQTGALPQFEALEELIASCDAFQSKVS